MGIHRRFPTTGGFGNAMSAWLMQHSSRLISLRSQVGRSHGARSEATAGSLVVLAEQRCWPYSGRSSSSASGRISGVPENKPNPRLPRCPQMGAGCSEGCCFMQVGVEATGSFLQWCQFGVMFLSFGNHVLSLFSDMICLPCFLLHKKPFVLCHVVDLCCCGS